LLIEDLFGNRVLTPKKFITVEVNMGLTQQRLITCELSLGLQEECLVRPRIDLGEEFAFLDKLSFLKVDAHKLSIHTATDCYRVEWRDRAEPGQIHGKIPLTRCHGNNGNTRSEWLGVSSREVLWLRITSEEPISTSGSDGEYQ
jgi:hypothetical protein